MPARLSLSAFIFSVLLSIGSEVMSSETLVAQRRNSVEECDNMSFNDPDDPDVCDEKKPLTVLDADTGLMVIERESDQDWNSNPRPKLPFNEIVKLKSEFDGTIW